MRAAGIVLVVIAAALVVPALTYAAYLWSGAHRDPKGLLTYAALLVAGLGACLGVLGGLGVYVGGRKD